MKYHPPIEFRRKRFVAALHVNSLHMPHLSGEFFSDNAWAALSWGDDNADPLWFIEITLTGTRFARVMCRFLDWRERRRNR